MTYDRFNAVRDRALQLRNKTGTYTPPGGVAIPDVSAIEQRTSGDEDKRFTMDVLVSDAVIPEAQIGANWLAYTDGNNWKVFSFRGDPGITVLEVERIAGTGAQTQ